MLDYGKVIQIMGFLGVLPGRAELVKRMLVAAIDGLNDTIDEPQEQIDLAKMIDNAIDIPFLKDDEEFAVVLKVVEKISDALELLEGVVKNK